MNKAKVLRFGLCVAIFSAMATPAFAAAPYNPNADLAAVTNILGGYVTAVITNVLPWAVGIFAAWFGYRYVYPMMWRYFAK